MPRRPALDVTDGSVDRYEADCTGEIDHSSLSWYGYDPRSNESVFKS